MQIKAATDRKKLRDFIAVPQIVQGNDPQFIARLDFEMSEHFSSKNPYFDHAQHQFFVAYDDQGIPCGRVSAQIDALAQKDGESVIGHFGCLEGADDTVIAALMDAAQNWLAARGATRISGPFSLSINDEMGLLVDGFDHPPRMMMGHAPPRYGETLEALGYQKAKDVFTFDMDVSAPLPKSLDRMAREVAQMENVSERSLDMKRFDEDLRVILDIFNDAWAQNWGFIPMTADEIAYAAKNMKMVIDPALARLVFVDGEPTAMIVALPDINEAARGLKGKLLPLGWLKFLWRLKIKRVDGVRVLLMGVRKNAALSSGLAALLIARIREAGRARGYKRAELGWVLEDNRAMSRLIEAAGGERYKTYRIYEKDLKNG